MPLRRRRSSTARFADCSGKFASTVGNEIRMNRFTPAAMAASMRLSCPCRSTLSMESPSCLDIVDDAVEMTALTPRHAASSDPWSFRSPRTCSAPMLFKCATRSGLDVPRTRARSGFPRWVTRRQISAPRRPVAPTTRIMVAISWARGPWVVLRVYVGDGPRSLAVQLQNRLALGPSEVLRARGPVSERPGDESPGRRAIKPLTHSKMQSALDDRRVLGLRVPVRKHLEAVRKPQAHREHSGLGWISLQDGHLRALRQGHGAVFPGELRPGKQRHRALGLGDRGGADREQEQADDQDGSHPASPRGSSPFPNVKLAPTAPTTAVLRVRPTNAAGVRSDKSARFNPDADVI